MNKEIAYHTRHIPEEQLNLAVQFAIDIKNNGLCDVLTEPYVTAMKSYGISVIETRLVWWEIEEKQGIYNFDRLKRDVELIENNGFQVGVFPWFQHPPEWASHIMKSRCLEHNIESNIPSLWDESLLIEYDRLYKALSEEFGDRIKFLYTGVYGDYGEVMYPSGVRHYKFSPPHNHIGFWCGDDLARCDFKKHIMNSYEDINKLNESWGTGLSSFDEDLMPRLPLYSNPIMQRIDFSNWYSGSLMRFTDNVCAIMRKYFPGTKAGLPIGSVQEKLELGQVKSISAKIAAKYNMIARWTGLAHLKDFARSNICARRLSSAARFYGGKFGVEAALIINKDNAGNSIYEALANSSCLIHNDPGNILRAEGIYEKYRHNILELPVKCDVSVYYPVEAEMCMCMDMNTVFDDFQALRDFCDYEITDGFMITDGFLTSVTDLVLPSRCLVPQKTADEIAKWEKNGGGVWYLKGKEACILENGQLFNCGRSIEDWSHFGMNDGCYYTNHGDRISKYNPKTGMIDYIG